MPEFDQFENNLENDENSYPDYFVAWDESLRGGKPAGFFDSDEFADIIEIYLSEGKNEEAVFTLNYSLDLYPEDEDFIYDVLSLLDDYERWNDILDACNKYGSSGHVWLDAYKLSALLHLRMEEDAFHYFGKMKSKYAGRKKELAVIYQYMGGALSDVDLYDASIAVADESIKLLGEQIDVLWLQLQNYQSLESRENVLKYAEKIQKKNPFDAETWSRLGEVYRQEGEIEKSIDAYEFVRSLGGHEPEDILNLAYDYENNGNDGKALEIIEEYIQADPDNYMACIVASNIASRIEEWDTAIRYIDRAMKLSPEEEVLYVSKAEYLINIGEYKKAIRTIEEGISKTKDPKGDLKKQLKKLKKQYPDI